jgi:uncharacterized protein YuzE
MTKPLSVKIDNQANAGYIRYAEGKVATTLDVWSDGWVAADIDSAGAVLGIELLGFDDETLQHARAFAESKGLAFPPHIEGALVPT